MSIQIVPDVVKTKRGRKGKWRDPDKPKRPNSAYNFFAKETYPKISQQMKNQSSTPSDVKATSIMSQIAIAWKQLNEAGRAQYVVLADAAKVEHGIKLEVYKKKKANGETQKKPRNKRDKTKPKRSKSAYLYFGESVRPQVKADLTINGEKPKVTAVMVELAQRWKSCNAAQRVQFQKLADDAKVLYVEAMEKWRTTKNDKPAPVVSVCEFCETVV